MRDFLSDPIPDEVLARVLIAAHQAGSVGFSQPWDFIIVRDLERRREVHRVFEEVRARNAAEFSGERREKFLSFKLEGILDAPINLIVTCHPERFGAAVLGKVDIREVELYSTCLAIENLWLAARCEGLGVGWVSIVRNDALHRIFKIPPDIIPVAYLCMGYVAQFPSRPIFQTQGWLDRISPRRLLHFDDWEGSCPASDPLSELVDSPAIWREILAENGDGGDEV